MSGADTHCNHTLRYEPGSLAGTPNTWFYDRESVSVVTCIRMTSGSTPYIVRIPVAPPGMGCGIRRTISPVSLGCFRIESGTHHCSIPRMALDLVGAPEEVHLTITEMK